ncbi:MAG: amidase, partial [Nitrospinota bacterium]
KTVTTEFANMHPGKTTNPHAAGRTPGGSSSGSAAAVAAHMVPVAIGTQTNGSTIRPASFCGVYGFKPSHGLISRHRVLQQSRPLDHVGVFGRTIEDVALAAEPMMAYDENDPDTRPRARPALVQTAAEEPPVPPRLAFVKTPVWDQAEADTKAAFAELMEHLGESAQEVQLPEVFDKAVEWHRAILHADLARNFEREYAQGKEKLSPILREMIEHGQKVLAVDYNRAAENRMLLARILDSIFEWYDAILTPAAPGEAPRGLESTGSPVFCTLWTLCGMPAVSVPILEGSSGMPMGAQLVAPRGGDARLLRTARWLAGAAGK